MRSQEQTAPNYENAEFIMARSLDKLKFYHVAMEYYFEVVRHGAAKELIVESLKSIMDTIDKRPYDAHLIENQLIAPAEFDFFPQDLDGLIRFIQGKIDFQRGDKDWATRFFDRIENKTVAKLQVQYALAVEELKQGRPDQAITAFEQISQEAPPKTTIRNQAIQSLARLLYEEKKFEDALKAYDQIDSSVLLWDDVFLEKAWNTYQLTIYDRTLGYLHALQAPIFASTFHPERYLLLGMTLKRLCRYTDVRDTLVAFREAYGKTLEFIRSGRALKDSEAIRVAARTRHIIKGRADLLQSLENEQKSLSDKSFKDWEDNGLTKHLKRLYLLKERELKTELIAKQKEALEQVSEELLYYNEQMNLLEYETRMDEFRRSRFSETMPPEKKKSGRPLLPKVLRWDYRGEFWIDELNHFRVAVEDMCGD